MASGSFAALTGLVLMSPFGLSPENLVAGKPWYAFEDHDAVLQLVRVERIAVKNCRSWQESVVSVPADELSPVNTDQGRESLEKAWNPWSVKDLDPIKDCDDFPCKVKFDSSETEMMRKAEPRDRFAKFLGLILERLGRYEKTGARKPYETEGTPVDPWKLFEEKGFKTSLTRPEKPVLFGRKLNFAPDRMLTIHQVLDRRHTETPVSKSGAASPIEAVVWERDAYTDHYFDSWGEWTSLHCDPAAGEAVVIQSLLTEMDLLKSRNIFAHAFFGKYRAAFEENGKKYLDRQFEHISKAAQEIDGNAAAAASSAASSSAAVRKRPTATR